MHLIRKTWELPALELSSIFLIRYPLYTMLYLIGLSDGAAEAARQARLGAKKAETCTEVAGDAGP